MSDLHQKVAARVAELRAIAEAGTGGEWETNGIWVRRRIGPRGDFEYLAEAQGFDRPADAALIVAAVNTLRRAIKAWEETLRRHQRRPAMEPPACRCLDCCDGYVDMEVCDACQWTSEDEMPWPCADIRALARAVGVLEEE